MILIFLIKGYSRRILKYPKGITLLDFTLMMRTFDLVTIFMERPRIDSGCHLQKQFIEFLYINLGIVLYLITNQVDSYHCYVSGSYTLREKQYLVDR